MRMFLKAVMKEGTFSIVLLAVLLMLVWGVGWYIGRENPDWYNWPIGISLVIVGMWAGLFVIQKMFAVRSAVRIEQQLKAQSGAQLEGAEADKKAEIEALRKKFDESLDALKKTKGGKSALFTLPWYVIIGPPGSGKTTALQESGLNFPAAQGGNKIRGVGGTRNCDWWFTEDGILLDTAGRYTTVAEDQQEWLAFLEMIRTSRKDKPINGAIVAVNVDELFQATESELDQMAKDIRSRLEELSARLQAVFPVYMMFTKCDLISGFVEFFEDFNKDERSQVWGFTLAYGLPDKQYSSIFDEQCDRMLSNIKARQLELLGTERPAAKKQAIYLFPRQFQLAREKMREFVEMLFGANAFQEAAVLRGIYFTSGTQKGTPIDQLLKRMGAAMGVGGDEPDEDRIEKKSFFINHLFTKIMFPDKTLARSSSRVLRRKRAIRVGVQLLSLMVLAVGAWASITSFVGNRQIVQAIGGAAQNLDRAGENTDADEDGEVEPLPPEDVHLQKLMALDDLRQQLDPRYREITEGRPASLGFGMYQGRRMFDAGLMAWYAGIEPLYVTPTMKRLRADLELRRGTVAESSRREDYEELLDLWRVYRMLGGELRPQPALISNVLRRNAVWVSDAAPAEPTHEMEALATAQLAFYAQQLQFAFEHQERYPLFQETDGSLIERVSSDLRTGFWIDNAYRSIIRYVGEQRPALTLEQLAGTHHAYLEYRSGTATTEFTRHINAYTQAAWEAQVSSLIDERARSLSELFRELGDPKEVSDLRTELVQRHLSQHEEVWADYLRGVYPRASEMSSVEQVRDSLRILTGNMTPYRTLIHNVWGRRALNIGPGQRISGHGDEGNAALAKSLEALDAFQVEFEKFAQDTRAGERVRGHMANPSRLRDVAQAFTNAFRDVRQPLFSTSESATGALLRCVEVSFDALRTEAVQELERMWRETVHDVFRNRMADRFPFNPEAETNVRMSEFSAMFNPVNGSIVTIERLLDSINELRFGRNQMIVLSSGFTDTRNQARDIRDAMFHDETDERVRARFAVTLVQRGLVRSSVIQVGTDSEGSPQQLRWNDNRLQTRDFVWAQHTTQVARMGARVEIDFGEDRVRSENRDKLDDEWGLLKLLQQSATNFVPIGGQEDGREFMCRWEFQGPDGQRFRLEAFITAEKSANPFRPDLFTRLRVAERISPTTGGRP
jgi:type VI secretion system IcmF/VasK family protein